MGALRNVQSDMRVLRDLVLFVGGLALFAAVIVTPDCWLIVPASMMMALPVFLRVDKDNMGAIVGRGAVPLRPPCQHKHVVPVRLTLTGELVANICLDCDRQLAAGWNPLYPTERAARPEPERR